MEILFITHKYPPSVGGMEKQSYELINGTAKYFKVHTLIYDNHSSRVKFLLMVPWRVKKILKKNPGISLIHLNDGLLSIITGMIKRITPVPVLATLHGLDIVFPSKLFQRFAVNQFKKLDGVIAVSRATAQECLDRGFAPEKVFVVRNGVDTDLAQIEKQSAFRKVMQKKLNLDLSDKKVLISIGRSVRRKGFSWFMTKILPKLDKNIIYVVIGPTHPHIKKINFVLNLLGERTSHLISLLFGLGIDEIDIQNAIKMPEIKKRAFYLGRLPFDEMVQFLKHADMYIMPNIKVMGDAEGFGLVALEASINDLPVLASAIEGITCAVIDGKNGFLVPAENEAAWIDKIHRLISDAASLKEFGIEARKYTIENYSWGKMVKGYVTVFEKYKNLVPAKNDKTASSGKKKIVPQDAHPLKS